MNGPLRIGLVVVLLVGLGVFVHAITKEHDAPSVPNEGPPRFTSSQQCKECHPAVFAEWEGSHHQIAYQNPEVRKLSDDFRNKECQACHLPRPIIETGLTNRTLPRMTRPDEGVDCLTCHLGAGGRIVGMNASSDGCAPIADPSFLAVELCQTCHNQHQTTDQWRASEYPARGMTCNACHMEPVERESGKRGFGHVYPGAHDVAMLRRAARFVARREEGNVVLELVNEGAGHNFPTEERHRAVDLMISFRAADGTDSAWERVYRFRQPYRDEPGENTQLPAHATHRAEVPIPEGASLARARVWYRLNPYSVDDDGASTLLFEEEVQIE